MEHFDRIRQALLYIDAHLDQDISYDALARHVHLSPYYFHRLFTLVVGKGFAAYVRDRRLQRACALLASGEETVLSICMRCGFDSAQAFSRAFRRDIGMSPSEYRRRGCVPVTPSVEEMIIAFTNRIRGGVYVKPRMIRQGKLCIAGASGDGERTGEVWATFEALHARAPLENRLSENGYEIRTFGPGGHRVHVGYAVPSGDVPDGYETLALPASAYAAFDVYVSRGYTSENDAMAEWIATNGEGYRERLLGGETHYVVEYYDERFAGEEAGSIVEIWVPVER